MSICVNYHYIYVIVNVGYQNSRLGIQLSKIQMSHTTMSLWDHMQTYILEYDYVELNFKHVMKII